MLISVCVSSTLEVQFFEFRSDFLRCWIPASILDVDPEQGHLGESVVPKKTGWCCFLQPVGSRSGGIVLDVKPGTALRLHDQWRVRPRRMPTPDQVPHVEISETPLHGEKWGFRYQLSTRCWQMWSWNCKQKGLA